MGWLGALIGIVASVLFYREGSHALMWLALAVSAATLWSYGIMHNFAIEAAKRRPGFTGHFYDITPREADAVPNGPTRANLTATLLAVILLGVSVVKTL